MEIAIVVVAAIGFLAFRQWTQLRARVSYTNSEFDRRRRSSTRGITVVPAVFAMITLFTYEAD